MLEQLFYVRKHGIIHGDVSLRNTITVKYVDGTTSAFVIDSGCAQHLQETRTVFGGTVHNAPLTVLKEALRTGEWCPMFDFTHDVVCFAWLIVDIWLGEARRLRCRNNEYALIIQHRTTLLQYTHVYALVEAASNKDTSIDTLVNLMTMLVGPSSLSDTLDDAHL